MESKQDKILYGIQQIGVGVSDAYAAYQWYATRLGADVPVFEDNNTATYMAPYMGGKPHEKRAILAMNMMGGSGYEIWQFLDRESEKPKTNVKIGDLGICSAFVKTSNIPEAYAQLQEQKETIISEIRKEPDGKKAFHLYDPFENLIKIKESDDWYAKNPRAFGGVFGCSIGVSNIENSLKLYKEVLGYTKVVYDSTEVMDHLPASLGGARKCRRVLLTHPEERKGGFSKLLGTSEIELVQSMEESPVKIFQDRYWGDIGFIHLCFDVRNMNALISECDQAGFPFKVLSSETFDMGDANGRWGYIEDADGTLIEFVETHKVPVLKKLGLSINLTKKDALKPVPNWMLRAMSLKRTKKIK